MDKKNNYFYIYNLKEALFFIQNGAFPLDIAVGGKGDVYHKFPRNETTENIFKKWKDVIGCIKRN